MALRVKPRRPVSLSWVLESHQPAGERWVHLPTMLQVITSVDDIQNDGPTWHISVTSNGSRATAQQAAFAVAAFGMMDAEEDNHGRIARQYWLPVDPARRRACECKTTETTIVEGDFAYTAPKDSQP